MFRRSGHRFADKNMRQSITSRAWPDSGGTGHALVAPSASATPTSVGDLAFDVAELDGGERDHDDHENDRLRRRPAEVAAQAPVRVDLVDQGLGRFGGAAAGHRVDDAEGVEERVD